MSNMSEPAKQEHGGPSNGNVTVQQQMNHSLQIADNHLQANADGTSPSTTKSKPQACKVCGKILSSASSYYVHMKLHSGTKPYRCSVSISLVRLIIGVRELTTSFVLQVCEAAFCRKPYLEVHMRTHTGERPFQCNLCLKRFSQKSSLNTHKRIHTGELHWVHAV